MYLSKIILNPESYRVQKELSNPYQLHRTIMNAFPDNLKEIKRKGRVLFKINKESKKPYPSVLIQSTLCPNWDFLIKDEQYLFKSPMYKQFNYPQFKKGSKYWFKLFCNPSKKINGNRIGMYKEEEQYNWLERKAEIGGFNILHANIIRKEEITAKVNKKSKKMTFYGIQFDGVLQVKNPETFQNILKNGIGSGKAFGFGFLTISKF